MWAKLNVKVNVHSMPRVQYFPKVLSFDTSAGLVGWGSSTFDAFYPLQSLSATYDGTSGAGISNIGRASDKQMDALLKKLNLAEDLNERDNCPTGSFSGTKAGLAYSSASTHVFLGNEEKY